MNSWTKMLPAIDEPFHLSNRDMKGMAGSYLFMTVIAVLVLTGILPLPKAPLLTTLAAFAAVGLLTTWAFHRMGFASPVYRLLNLLETQVFLVGLVVTMAISTADSPVLWVFYVLLTVIHAHHIGASSLGVVLVSAPPLALLGYVMLHPEKVTPGQMGHIFGYTVLTAGLFMFFGKNREAQLDLSMKQLRTENELHVARLELQTRRKLRVVEDEWLEVLQGMASTLVLLDKQMDVVDVRGSDALGGNASDLLSPDFLRGFESSFAEADQKMGAVSIFGATLPRESGFVDLKILALPLSERREHYALLIQDASERVALEETSKKFMHQLLVSDKLNSVGLMAAGIAHEVNNPLTYVAGNVDYLLLSESSNETLRTPLLDIKEGIRQITSIMGELKGFSRTVSGGYRQSFDLRETVNRASRLLSGEIKNISLFELDLPETPVFVRCHPDRIQQVIVNLLVNARQALPERQPNRNSIRMRLVVEGDRARVFVSDNGIGMSEEIQRKIFDLFYTTKAPGTGTGLGLSISYKIAREHEGDLAVISSPGTGSTFTLSLPLVSTPDFDLPILIVDDEERLLQLYSRVLKNFTVTTASSISAALPMMGQPFRAVLSDVRLTDGSGFDLYERAPDTLKKRFLFLTGLPSDTPELGDCPPGVRILHKPIQFEELEKELYALAGDGRITTGL